MGNNQVAFFIGLLGSVHCVGMCGPLAFSIPSLQKSWLSIVADKLLYNLGRVLTYATLGLLLGYLGKLLWLAGAQQMISVTSGIVIIAVGLVRVLKYKNNKLNISQSLPFYKLINFALKHHAGHFALGMLNGLLPCGFVYVALFGALNTSSAAEAATFMFWFGIGTVPLMLTAALSFKLLGPLVRRRINFAMPYLMIVLGCWFILRGAGLDLPYLSPLIKASGASVCH
ncbi:sulfite exporter TauE/SafE family protein [Mucilaginibacter terrenus]|uniref:Sulfite exporter TauE/SafE family protein n=1 Tax=Mucilaginibacter terrenus TaxID=2482727 RepID=A0A3E2NWD3_9SPHI|nr:sulfite exporter TauE/SafE family protein [Mucilaginibacter terrenus]RFZ85318.1 sulfite exporter TauE/SafE family protein [Mucilaginibacter terrenus]